ncbi:GPW/gp25 family protein [Duganella sp.]|uniref:GPW/gp25 family protein n=1 Tax=Duganella sp. TaxID=1904440 RepID=UPI0031D9E1C5
MALDEMVFSATPSGPEAVDAKAFLGCGLAFPVTVAGNSALQLAEYEEDIAQAVRIILDTNPGERVMRPDFGAGLRALAFEPINTQTLALARHRVEQALILWEPRIDSIAVVVTSRAAQGQLHIDLRYRIRSTNTFYNLVYPFFLQEGRTS